ncbi:MAG: lytic murein transglycosylase B [Pseudomonadota bacterium]
MLVRSQQTHTALSRRPLNQRPDVSAMMPFPTRICRWFACLTFALTLVPAQADYSRHPDGVKFIERMQSEHGIDAAETRALLAGLERYDAVLEAMSRPAEKTLTWAGYRPIFLKPDRVTQGIAFYREHRDAIDSAVAQYGVPAEIITAIIGVESRYGRYKGKHPALRSLATLAFDFPRRSRFFTRELEEFLLLAREEGLDPLSVKGSYAAAMGMPQFISSSYRAYAVDGDSDGRRNLFGDIDDVVHSVANYFDRHGWRTGEPVTERVTPRGQFGPLVDKGYKPALSLDQLAEHGVPAQAVKGGLAALVELAGADGEEHWLAYPNFYVITRYNHSPLYAMAVFQLAQAIKNGMH